MPTYAPRGSRPGPSHPRETPRRVPWDGSTVCSSSASLARRKARPCKPSLPWARALETCSPSPEGSQIARSLGRARFDAEDLYRPRESVAFGSWYLAEQIRNLGGRPLLALAAYNGGAGSAQRWSGRNFGIDPDDFVDAIDFAETRGYVRSIYQIYSRYQQLYG